VQQAHWYGALMAGLVTGVPIFFALSGFLLYRPFFSSALGDGPRPPRADFTRRRLLQIVPAYWLALTVLSIKPGLADVFTHDWWRYYGFLQTYDPVTRPSGLTVAWTLCIEVTFYLALPVYAAFSRRAFSGLERSGQIRADLALLTGLGLASLVLGFALHPAANPTLLSYFDWFAFGMGLAVLSVVMRGTEQPPRPVRLITARPALSWAVALVLYLVMCAVLSSAPQYAIYSPGQEVISHIGQALVAFFIVLPAAIGEQAGGWPRRLLARRELRWLGLISYGVYLWHLTIATWLSGKGVHEFWALLVITFALTVAAAAASYYVVERPILRFKDRRRRGASPVPAASP